MEVVLNEALMHGRYNAALQVRSLRREGRDAPSLRWKTVVYVIYQLFKCLLFLSK